MSDALIEYGDASPEVRAVYDDIMATRQVDWINNFWKALAHDPVTLKRTWESIKQIMAPGALDALTKEMIYVAVSVTNQCGYCIASHTVSARNKGMTDAMFQELMAVVGMANETNRLAARLPGGDRRAVQGSLTQWGLAVRSPSASSQLDHSPPNAVPSPHCDATRSHYAPVWLWEAAMNKLSLNALLFFLLYAFMILANLRPAPAQSDNAPAPVAVAGLWTAQDVSYAPWTFF